MTLENALGRVHANDVSMPIRIGGSTGSLL